MTLHIQASLVALLSAFMAIAHASGRGPSLAKPLPDNQSVIIENTNLTTRAYLNARMSKSVDERQYAGLYLLGVLDATEGHAWCDYKTFKTITIDERLFVEFEKLSERELDDRAARVITKILSKTFPCRGIK